jgi:hypothetical protein
MNDVAVLSGPRRAARRLLKPLRRIYTVSEKRLYTLGMRSTKALCLPDFLGIGAQKAGTSWIYENLIHHPELYLPEEKELHYFDLGFDKSLWYYSEKFRPGVGRLKGEITPSYSILPLERVRFIRDLMPDLRLIFIMRNPIDRAWSQALMNLVQRKNRKLEAVDESEFYAHFKAERSVKRGDYRTVLSNWQAVFPHEQLFIAFFEDITNRPQELLSAILKHIGVSCDIDWESFPYRKVVNKGLTIHMPEKYRDFLKEMYCHEIELLYERFGAPVAPWRCS